MAAIDKMNEFYTCLKRFAFLSKCYAPEDIDESGYVYEALQNIQQYAKDPEVMKRTEEAEDYFNDSNSRIQRINIASVLSKVLEEVTR